ncbi:MAG: ATP-binding protein [Candidatus Diapherotrites archaeon]|uniref:ATP-binding protein n=1 Tax=Candidatus Iainarchaeum sp. TaxID=3101447 RepID=A0A8T3YLI8_9ARCH|nr:ATP-binding protein [Candidatus Diapherotrites archaeon]
MPYADLLRFNPWWENAGAIDNDPDIARFGSEPIKHFPVFETSSGVYVIRGPRQVGKTTLVKLKIKELLENGTSPQDIFFYSFELLHTPQDVYGVVLEYLETVASGKKRHLFLDETTTISDWARSIKLLVDRGDIKREDVVLVTGSSSLDLKKGAERLPGRGIEGNEFFYLPSSFRLYLKLKGIEVPSADPLGEKIFYETARKSRSKILLLNKEFASYLNHGGFLYSINHGKGELALEKYARWLEGDFIKWGKNPLIAKEIVQAVIRKACSQFSYHAIAKETSVSSHNTVIDYLGMVDEELFLRTVNKVTLPFKAERKKEKKAFFLDTLLVAVAERWAGQSLPMPCKTEQVVGSHLSRLGHVYFYDDGKKEIDYVLKIKNKVLGVEVKWSDNISRVDTYGVKRTDVPYILSKETLKTENGVPVIPVSLFLAMLEAKEIVKRDVLNL